MAIEIGDGYIQVEKGDTFSFSNVGDQVNGIIVHVEEQPKPEGFVDGKPVGHAVSRNGRPLFQWLVVLDTGAGVRKHFYTKWRAQKAIEDAVRRAGEREVAEGAFLSVTRKDDEKGAGPYPAHTFEAQYEPPTGLESGSTVDDTAPF